MLDVQDFKWTKEKWHELSVHAKYKMEIIAFDWDFLGDFKS